MVEIERLNWSTLKHIATSPKLMQWRVEHPQEDTEAMKLGRAIHCLVLEPDKFASHWVIATVCQATKKNGEQCGNVGTLYAGEWFCKVKGHAPADAGPLPEGIESVTVEAVELAKQCAESIKAHPVAMNTLKGGQCEQECEWTDQETGVACRGRLDFIGARYIVDLKTTSKETPREFVNDAASRLYHGQLSWYHDGAIAAGRLPQDADAPRIVTVGTTEPYDVAVYQFTEASLEAGRFAYRWLLDKYVSCQAASWWPGHSPDLQPFDLPRWAEGVSAVELRGVTE